MFATYVSGRDATLFRSPVGWDYSITDFRPDSFGFSELRVPVGDHIEVAFQKFRGHIRYRAHMVRPGLQINFIDAYVTPGNPNNRLQGFSKIDRVAMLTFGGYDWDALSNNGAFGIEINLREPLYEKIISHEIDEAAYGQKTVFGYRRSIVVSPSYAGLRLRSVAIFILKQVAEKMSVTLFSDNFCFNQTHVAVSELNLLFNRPLIEFFTEVYIDAAEEMLLRKNEIDLRSASSASRRRIALDIERFLIDGGDIQLHDISDKFGISRRTVQLALKEQFGCGFSDLKRTIKLNQARRIIRANSRLSITQIANELNMSHLGRFSSQYRQFFGVSPSQDRSSELWWSYL